MNLPSPLSPFWGEGIAAEPRLPLERSRSRERDRVAKPEPQP